MEEDGQPVVDMQTVEKRIDAETEAILQDLARAGVLMK
jgi:hypothetical protein